MKNPKDIYTLLVVDDEKEILKALRRQFRKKYRVIVADNASLALHTLSKEDVQVIVSDQRMPDMTGTEMFGNIKNRYPDAVRILLTGYSDIQAVIDSINKGSVYQYLVKPWNHEELNDVIEKAFERFWLIRGNQQLLNELKETNQKLEKEIHERKKIEQDLKNHQNFLESEVEKRTAQLTQMNKDLTVARDMAERANESKSIFLANMSHDIRTPMNGIIGMVDILKETSLSSDQHNYINTISDSADTLLGIINDILDFSKIEANQLELENVELDLYKLVRQTVALLSSKAKEKQIDLLFSFEPQTPTMLVGDPVRIQQILFNLIGNAIKFTHSGAINVTISALQTQHPVIIKIVVKDTGVGISEEHLKKLFKPFLQADQSITRKYGGTGLGLSITKQLVEMMGGNIQVQSKLHAGSVFTAIIHLKRRKQQSVEDTERKDDLMAACKESDDKLARDFVKERKLRVLIVEDTRVNQRVVSIFLKKLNCVAELANDGVEAISKLKQYQYDLVLMDVMMPNLDGFSATKIIRDPESSVLDHDVPIIAMTANALKGDREKCLNVGMDDYLSKPVKFNALINILYKKFCHNKSDSQKDGLPSKENIYFNAQNFLDRFDHDYPFCQELILDYIQLIADSINNLRSLSTDHVNEILDEIYSIIQMSQNIAAHQMESVARTIEKAIHTKETNQLDFLIEDLQKAFENSIHSFQKAGFQTNLSDNVSS
jgi:signal transduction histidine kinase/BarA-like signal transduction histidine kinase